MIRNPRTFRKAVRTLAFTRVFIDYRQIDFYCLMIFVLLRSDTSLFSGTEYLGTVFSPLNKESSI